MQSATIPSSSPFGGLNQMGGSFIEQLKANKWMILIVVLFVGLFVYLYFSVFKKSLSPLFKPNSERVPDDGSAKGTAEILVFTTDWCPHCTAAKPAIEDIERQYNNTTVNGHKIIITRVDCTDESPEVEAKMNELGVEGFPTIKMIKDGQVIEFDAKPTKDNLEQFINTVV